MVYLFSFLKINMFAGQPMAEPMQVFYKGVLKVCVVILHDFPDFFCDFHFNLVNSLPEHCIQLKNLVLSAIPPGVNPPNPFARNLKVDVHSDMRQYPRILSNYENYLSFMNLKEDLEAYLQDEESSYGGRYLQEDDAE